MKISDNLRAELIQTIPALRAFAVSLCRDRVKADDLVQVALKRGWEHLDGLQEGTDLRAWLFTILRNVFYSERRKRRLEVEDPDGGFASKLSSLAAQDGHMDLRDFQDALRQLPPNQQQAVLLVGAFGMSYQENNQEQGQPCSFEARRATFSAVRWEPRGSDFGTGVSA